MIYRTVLKWNNFEDYEINSTVFIRLRTTKKKVKIRFEFLKTDSIIWNNIKEYSLFCCMRVMFDDIYTMCLKLLLRIYVTVVIQKKGLYDLTVFNLTMDL